MTARLGRRGRMPPLTDRDSERAALDQLVNAVRSGESRALVVRGDPGVGKTVLLDHLAGQASGSGCRVECAAGMQSEMELAFAGLHQLCAPMLDRAERLPVPQRDALRTAFGIAAGPPPDRFLVGLAVLSLLSGTAGERPLICVIDDEQWLDQASAQALRFAARRLAADPVGVVFAAREPSVNLAGLPELGVEGLRDDDARALLDSALAGPLDAQVRDLIVAETGGNPLALLELPRGLTPAELAGGFGLPSAAALTGRIEDSFRRQLEALPDQNPAAAATGSGRSVGRPGAGVAGGQAARHPRPGCGAGRRGGAGRVRRPGALPASVAAFRGVPVGAAGRAAADARGAGGGDRSAGRSGSPGLAPGPGRGWAGRGGRRRARAVGEPGAGPGRDGGGRGVPGPGDAADC